MDGKPAFRTVFDGSMSSQEAVSNVGFLDDSLDNDIKIRKWIESNSKVKSKIDSVPSPGYFLQNYF